MQEKRVSVKDASYTTQAPAWEYTRYGIHKLEFELLYLDFCKIYITLFKHLNGINSAPNNLSANKTFPPKEIHY